MVVVLAQPSALKMTKNEELAPVPFEKRIRPFLIGFIVIPISVVLGLAEHIKRKFLSQERNPSEHDVRVGKIIKAILDMEKSGAIAGLRTDRDSAASHSLRITKKVPSSTVKLRDLNCILGLDRKRGVIRVEPGVTVGEVTTYLLEHNLQLEGRCRHYRSFNR